jgi:anti-sigma factor RsiW
VSLERKRSEGCVSDFTLDRWVSEELSTAEREPLEAHVEACARCRERIEAVRAARAAFPAELPRTLAALVARIAERRRRKATPARSWLHWLPHGGGAIAMAAVLLLFVRSRQVDEGSREARRRA